MNKKYFSFIRIVAMFFIATYALFPEPIIVSDESAYPGGAVRITAISEGKLKDITAILKAKNGKEICSFKGFAYSVDSSLTCMTAIVSFPLWLEKGDYTVFVVADELPATDEQESVSNFRLKTIKRYFKTFQVTLIEKKFREDIIKLNEKLTSLQTEDGTKRKKESIALFGIFNTFRGNNVHSDTVFEKPLKTSSIITSYFGDRRKFMYTGGNTTTSVHNGIDMAVKAGTPVYANGAGVVVFSGYRIITGHSIIIEHLPGLYSMYYHLEKRELEEGMAVEKGAVVGSVGSSGLSTGAHLHWEVRNQAIPVDPEFFLTVPPIDKDRIKSIIKANISDLAQGR